MQDNLQKISSLCRVSWRKAPKWQRILIIMSVGLFALKISVGWLSSSISELKSVNQSITEKMRLAKIMELEAQGLIAAEKELRAAEARLDSLSETLLDRADPSLFLPELNGHKDVEYLLVKPEPLIDHVIFKEFPLGIKFTAFYPGFVAYLKYLEELEAPVAIREIKMRAHSGSPRELQVSMLLSSFVSHQADLATIANSDYSLESDMGWETDYNTEQKLPLILNERKSVVNISPGKVSQRSFQRPKASRRLFNSTPSGLKISGFWSGSKPKVAINGQLYSIGEKIQGWTLLKIDAVARTVLISRNGVQKILRQ